MSHVTSELLTPEPMFMHPSEHVAYQLSTASHEEMSEFLDETAHLLRIQLNLVAKGFLPLSYDNPKS